MKKTLIIVAHPHIEQSVINKRWLASLRQSPEQFTIHELYKAYPDEKINIEKEHAIVEEHDNIIFQFPIYWFSSPPLLKKWLDEVFTYGWAYGSKGNKLATKKLGLAVSLGSDETSYTEPYTIDAMLLPFKMTSLYVNAKFNGIFALYGANTESNKATVTSDKIEQSAKDYIQFLANF